MISNCKNCNKMFEFKTLRKSIFWEGFHPVVCKNCGVKHKITVVSRLIFATLNSLPLLVFLLLKSKWFFNPLIVYLIWIILMYYISPFIVNSQTKE